MHVYAPAPSIERVIAKIHAAILNCRNSMRRALRRPCHTVRFLDCARNDRVGRSTVRRLLSFRFFTFCHFDRSIVFSLAFAQNRGFCAKEERQRSEVARRVYAACLERSLPRRARGEIPERKRRTKGRRSRFIVKFLSAIELTYSIIQLQLPTVNNCTPKKTGGARALRGRRRYAA